MKMVPHPSEPKPGESDPRSGKHKDDAIEYEKDAVNKDSNANPGGDHSMDPYQAWYYSYLNNLYYTNPYYMISYAGNAYQYTQQPGDGNAKCAERLDSPGSLAMKKGNPNQPDSTTSTVETRKQVGQDDELQPDIDPSDVYTSGEIASNLLQPTGMHFVPITSSSANQRFVDYTVYGSFNKLTGKFQRLNTANQYGSPIVEYGIQERPDIAYKYFHYDNYIEEQGRIRSSAKSKPSRRFTKSEIAILKRRKKDKKEKKLRAAYLED